MLFLGIIVTNAQTDTDPTGWVYVGDSKDYEGEHVVNVGLVDANGNALSFGTDDVLWLGAFIEDECRGIVEIANETTNAGVVYYFPMRVKGSSNDNDKAISFKLYKSSISEDPDNLNIPQPSEFWYELNELNGNSLTYVNGTEANFPSELFKLQFVEPTGYTFPNNLTVNVNETIDLLPLFEWEPANANVPTNAAIKWQYSQSYANFGIEDNLLLGNSQSGPNDEPQQSYFYFTIIGMNESNETEVKVFVREPITAITISDDYQEEKEVYINESYRLTNIMNNCYTKSAMSDGNYNKGTYPYEPYKPTYFEFNPKWNWFGTPYQFDRAVNDIMTKIDFAEGDRIISKAGGFTEFNGSEWEGSLTTLKAGEGYLLYTGIEAYSSFEYPAEYELGKPASQPSNAHALNKHANVWDYNAAQFSDNMSMIADLGEEFADDRYSIGAYINGECRGEGVCVNGKWFITIHGDAASNGQAINFRVYDTMNGKTYDVDTTQPYNQMAGSLKAPISLKVAGSSTGIESISADSLNPNAKYYTIDGIEVTNPTTGLYIVVDGNKAQKVYVK